MSQRWPVPDDETGPRRWMLHVITLTLVVGGALFGVAGAVLWLQGEGSFLDIVGAVGIVVLGGGVYFLTRRGRLRTAGILVIVLLTLVPAYFLIIEGPKFSGIVFYAGSIVFADLVVGGRIGLVMAAINSLLYLGLGLAHQLGLLTVVSVSPFTSDVVSVVLILVGLALAAGLFTGGMRQAIRQAEEREAALQAVSEEKARLLAELAAREEAQARLLETVRELSSPVIPVAAGVIAMPVVGTVDSARAQQIRTALLRGVADYRARAVIIDITGVAVVDTAVAQALLQAAQGVELLGAIPVLVGIRSEVAQTLIAMGVDMRGIVARVNLQEGLAYAREALAARGLAVQDRDIGLESMLLRRCS